MSTLYEIDAKYFNLLNQLEESEGELSPELSAELEISEVDFKAKVLAYRNVITSLKGDIDLADQELKRINGYKASKVRNIERLKESIDNAMQLRNLKEYSDGPLVSISYRKSTSVVVDEDELPKKWFVFKKSPDKVGIGNALKAGKTIAGAKLHESQNIQIR